MKLDREVVRGIHGSLEGGALKIFQATFNSSPHVYRTNRKRRLQLKRESCRRVALLILGAVKDVRVKADVAERDPRLQNEAFRIGGSDRCIARRGACHRARRHRHHPRQHQRFQGATNHRPVLGISYAPMSQPPLCGRDKPPMSNGTSGSLIPWSIAADEAVGRKSSRALFGSVFGKLLANRTVAGVAVARTPEDRLFATVRFRWVPA